jgi:hypothetical protein
MWRIALQTALLFLTPFLAYVGFQLLQRRWPFVAELWRGRVLPLLTIAGLLTAIAGVLTLGLTRREQGAYVPAHVENGRLVPGEFK